MKKADMERIIGEEMKHIPEMTNNFRQQMFRYFYNYQREIILKDSPNKSKSDAIETIVELYKKVEPDFNPSYNREWFEKGD